MTKKQIFLPAGLILVGLVKLILAGLILWSPLALAAKAQQWVFRSPYDNFTIDLKRGQYFIGRSPVNLKPLKNFMPLFSMAIKGDCPDELAKKADMVITVKRGKKNTTRQFYLADRQLKEGDNCIDMDGEGIYYLPLHRSWFVGPHEGKVPLGPTLKVRKEGTVFVKFIKKRGQWVSRNSGFFPNWLFFNQFIAALKKYQISGRLHPLAAEGKKSFQVITNRRTYKFFKIDDNLWGVKSPQKDWIHLSPSFAFLMNMSTDLWRDPRAIELATLKDSTQPADNRIQALKQIGTNWSQAIKKVFHTILLDPEESPQVKAEVALAIKQKPTTETFGVLIQALNKTKDIELLNKITKILRIQDHKGPVIQITSSQDEVNKSIRTWKRWWKTKGSKRL